MLAGLRDAGRVDLREAGVGEARALLVRRPRRAHVAGVGVGGEVEGVAVASRAQEDRVGRVGLELPGDEVARHDAARHAVDDHELHHLAAGEHLDRALAHLAHQGAVGAQQELLAGLAPGEEGAGDLGPAEGAVIQGPAVVAREGHALGHALVDDGVGDLGQAVDVGLAGPVVAALDRVVEEPPDRVAVVGVVLGRVDAALGRDGVGAPGAVLDAEDADVVAELGQRRRGRGAGQAGADHDDVVLALVGGVDQLEVEAVLVPLLGDRPVGDLGVEFEAHWAPPRKQAQIGMAAKAPATATAKRMPTTLMIGVYLGCSMPRVWKALWKPWLRCRPRPARART